MNCGTCRSDPKYKCPTCMVPYCSVACYKLHKQNPCIKPPSPPKQTIGVKQAVENLYPTEDTVPLHRLNLLGLWRVLDCRLKSMGDSNSLSLIIRKFNRS
uniref:HIT-type domain-containing protein n=1 Tax=Bombyx mori TaxID=7091 RepID=A0A8R2LX65_BOMMO|nr:zinc finger HIT domain-containing protein 3 isoform X2 [Bombyx mori]